ncbi:Ferredoxin [Acidipropionibacterium acidipropionici ATCC 4875]|uniref:Ferredoxin n=1 Tax=Acidipropionibacterium acidipropionici (strain ATCC 4875 / DSM 20272 / JCM 6432 / NBRC 12425 / NCIMB 8070 / 4) TaxID=1171373 RepID=K7RNS6_ACIA4|nr:(2Fe-2S) ferredoxin domain-containing protein [Acidipropionibacterium acidipropionici]AFV87931.1 Ferredoxin [Acidipropionibacterium acidipropionici ATCC 4875]ALN14681.1 hypothetical protein ASQ49_04660 [Acidipropionibacterium acidipropionici]APZ09564.1 hypothetical protein BWX38_10265 [Acidipropionibacterium acidipropionici]
MDEPDPSVFTARLLVGLTFPDAERCARWAGEFPGWRHAQMLGDGLSLRAALDEAARRGARAADLVGMTTLDVPVAVSWLRRVAGNWMRRWDCDHPGETFTLRVCRHVLRPGEEPGTAYIDTGNPGRDWGWRPVTGREAGLTSPAWQEVPPVRYQLLVCRGPRCNARSGDLTVAAISEELHRRGVEDEDVLLTQTGCMFPCNHAPVVVVQPDAKWMTVTPETVPELINDLLGPEVG